MSLRIVVGGSEECEHRPDCPGRGEGCTYHSGLSDAELCALRGWQPGDVLEGDEGFGPRRIRLTAVGEEKILARGPGGWEATWTLGCRCWGRVSAESEEPAAT